jgi:hypothetical protein
LPAKLGIAAEPEADWPYDCKVPDALDDPPEVLPELSVQSDQPEAE